MAGRAFKPKLAPSRTPHSFYPSSRYASFVKTVFSQNAIFLFAALFQLLVCVLLPDGFAIVPAAVLLLGYVLSSLLHLLSQHHSTLLAWSPPSPYTEHVVPGRATAQFPSCSSSGGRAVFASDTPASQGLVVFNLGVQTNHPLGWLCPGGRETSEHFLAMHAELLRDRGGDSSQHGLIAGNTWRGNAGNNASTILVTYYFRDVRALHRFAHGPLHRAAWDWYGQGRRYPHIGVYHETFEVAPRSYETVYVNCSPIGLGAGSVRCGGGEGSGGGDSGGGGVPTDDHKGGEEERWVNTLVSADVPALKTQMARMGRDEQGNELR
ncbi:hypothetical protein JDV02_005064 [Purpureocillium takamizusanense]|uniref:Monooxygenase n=1 Tax=Purpureocillium takamizusanense TaxID=2060973 RepID=A0A9Q8QF58_9HYPO|nr:uncharacterized protein JDV02_005064 [Purpureocillium takamizusanense]UNI18818.1 hypothetical protein JDV02_005064 [Purpureocillium takamizusanense]